MESLEGRALLSTVHASATTPKKQPAAFKPATNSTPKHPPYDITVQVNPDSGGGGTGNIFQKNVLVTGAARGHSPSVWLAKGLKPGYFTTITQADALGNYAFLTGVGQGSTVLQVFAENAAQNYSNVASVTVDLWHLDRRLGPASLSCDPEYEHDGPSGRQGSGDPPRRAV